MSKRGKILIVVCDGLGDRPVESLGGKTPLQYAEKKWFDQFAEQGVCGIMDPIAPGIRAGSDTSHLAILGYDPYEVYTGRGPYEAAGIGIDVKKGDVAFRCNFSTVDDRMRVVDRRAGRIKEGTGELAKSVMEMGDIEGIEIIFKESVEHRAVLVLRGEGLSPHIRDVDPHDVDAKVEDAESILEYTEDEKAKFTASVLTVFVKRSHEILREHPVNKERIENGLPSANIILPRGAGLVPHMPDLQEKHGLKSACIVGISLVKGICRIAGMDVVEVEGATGGADTDMTAKARAALDALSSYDLVLVNVKICDLFGHDGDGKGKAKAVERLDEMMGILKKGLDENHRDTVAAITADHSTPVAVMDHSGDPVPLAIYGKGVRTDDVKEFDEVALAKGGLGRIRGTDLLNILMNLINTSEKFGA